MIVEDLYLNRVTLLPTETYPPLVVHLDTPLSFSVSRQLFQLVAGRNREVLKSFRRIQNLKFPLHSALNIGRKSSGTFTTEEPLGLLVSEAWNHVTIATSGVNNVKR